MKFIKWMAERRLNYFDLLVISIAGAAIRDDMWISSLVICVIGGFASVVIERKAVQA